MARNITVNLRRPIAVTCTRTGSDEWVSYVDTLTLVDAFERYDENDSFTRDKLLYVEGTLGHAYKRDGDNVLVLGTKQNFIRIPADNIDGITTYEG